MKLIVFTEASCRPCAMVKALAERFAKRFDLEFEAIPAEFNRELFAKWDVCGVPTVVIADGDKKIGYFTGSQTESSFENNLRKLKVIE